MADKNKIMILCKVVDNFGDIGVVYRLARSLCDLKPELELTLVVSNLDSFHKMASQVNPQKSVQDFHYKNSTWKILDWNLEPSKAASLFTGADFPFSIVLECFQCGRPDWLENILFAPDFNRTVQIINIDYLTAEDYADEFHLLKSGTRKTNIKKIFFMPGFTPKTGGLIFNKVSQNKDFNGGPASAGGLCEVPLSLHTAGTAQPPLQSLPQSDYKIFFFAYEDTCSSVVQGISTFQEEMKKTKPDFSVTVFLAEGKSSAPFLEGWEKAGRPFKIQEVPFMQQEEFDFFITKMDFLFVRGEDSLARAALTGLPFVWQAYRQEENYQLVKVNALLQRMKDFFAPEEFSAIEKFWQTYNDCQNNADDQELAKMLYDSARQKNTKGFKDFAETLHKNGNLAEHLLNFIEGLNL